jgi:hypothetical protein
VSSSLSLGSAKGGRFRFSSRCAFLAQRDARGVLAALFAEPSSLRLSLGSFWFAWGGSLSIKLSPGDNSRRDRWLGIFQKYKQAEIKHNPAFFSLLARREE